MHLITCPSVSPHGLLFLSPQCLLLVCFHSCAVFFFFNLCAESLQSMVMVLSRVESEGEVSANPVAAAASASGINPVSVDHYYFFFSPPLTATFRVLTGLKSLHLPPQQIRSY